MAKGDWQRRDGSPRRAQHTSGDHAGNLYGPKGKQPRKPTRKELAKALEQDRDRKQRAVEQEWRELFARIEKSKQRQERRDDGAGK